MSGIGEIERRSLSIAQPFRFGAKRAGFAAGSVDLSVVGSDGVRESI